MDPVPQVGDATGMAWGTGGQGVSIPMFPQPTDGVIWDAHDIPPNTPGPHPPVGWLWLVCGPVP